MSPTEGVLRRGRRKVRRGGMKIHVGELIGKELERSGMGKKEFSRRLFCSRENVYRIIGSENIDVQQLMRIGEILGCDFFAMISQSLQREEREKQE